VFAVNPNDERYKDLIGKKVKLPIVGREIPIFADEYVDMEFGTGAVKVTPAHDVNDYGMGQRHKLEIVNILSDATTNKNVPDWLQGLDRFEARKKVVEWFEQNGLMERLKITRIRSVTRKEVLFQLSRISLNNGL